VKKFLLLVCLLGCSSTPEERAKAYQDLAEERDLEAINYMPQTATVEKKLGNGWIIFNLEGRRFLYHFKWAGQSAAESMTELQSSELN
jgi:hypothetical protein